MEREKKALETMHKVDYYIRLNLHETNITMKQADRGRGGGMQVNLSVTMCLTCFKEDGR